MFRRKKSTADIAQHGSSAAVSISGPMRIAAQAPHGPSPSSPSSSGAVPAPLYERFARTTTNASTGAERKSGVGSRPGVADGEAGTPRSSGAGRTAHHASRPLELGISAPSREDVSRNSKYRQQQLSPPTSPTFPRAQANPSRKMMPNVEPNALDDDPPPRRLVSKPHRAMREQENSVNVKTERENKNWENPPLTRILTPPSPPPPVSFSPTTKSTASPSTPLRPLGARSSHPPPAFTLSSTSTSPSSTNDSSSIKPSVDESGALNGTNALQSSPSLGNSLEGRRAPRKVKYSPLAAFGPSTSTSSTDTTPSASSTSSSQEVPPPLPPKPRTSFLTSPTLNSTNHAADPDSDPSRPSLESFSYSDRRASVQPLKTASVELRVGLGVDELQTFHSPLFGAGFGARSSEDHVDAHRENEDRIYVDPHTDANLYPKSRTSGARLSPTPNPTLPDEPNNRLSAVPPSSSQKGVLDADSDARREEEKGKRINATARGKSGRVLPQPPPPLLPPKMASTETLKISPAPSPLSMRQEEKYSLHEKGKGSGELYGMDRSMSTSSAGSGSGSLANISGGSENMSNAHFVHSTDAYQPQTPRMAMRGQIPTPPTSVDGHGHEYPKGLAQMTIASVLEGEHDSGSPASSSLESRRMRKTSSARHTDPKLTSSALPADIEMNGRIGHEQSSSDIIASDMTGRTTFAPSLSASSSSSSAATGMQSNGKPMPKLYTQNLPSPAHVHNSHQSPPLPQGYHTPISPPQSPPQSIQSIASPSQPRSRSKSRVRSNNRPGTGSSVQSLNSGYGNAPPSSASSSDGTGRSPSVFTVNANERPSSRKLTKSKPPHLTRPLMTESPIEQHDHQPEQDGVSLVDADPFAKGEIVRTPASEIGSMIPPAPSFANDNGKGSRPSSPAGDYFSSRSRRRGDRLDEKPRDTAQASLLARSEGTETPRPPMSGDAGLASTKIGNTENDLIEAQPELVEPTFFPLEQHLMNPDLLKALLPYLVFRDWSALIAINDALRRAIEHRRELREIVLEYFLNTAGYVSWQWSTKEHIMLTFRDLNSYMRGVSIPSHQYAVYAKAWSDAKQQVQKQPEDEYIRFNLKAATAQKSLLASSCRAYTRVVLRLRAQAEAMERDGDAEDVVYQFSPPQSSTSVNTRAHAQIQGRRSASRVRTGVPSRPASPTASSMSHSHHGHGHPTNGHGKVNRYERAAHSSLSPRFRSPLFRLGHAPCLRVSVPSPEGAWLSDASVLECEKELKRAGVVPLLRVGDVVWDVAVGDEGNVGRLVWDGSYLIDLDYTFSRTGELPQYLHTLSFPPSYFHRVIRTPGNPICHIDISPWGEEIAANLQLLQDRVKTETPQGGHHMVVRWIHRSKFRIRPNPYTNAPIAIPDTSLSVDPGWFGTVIIEIEGTNEGLADLQQRCKTGFPPRAMGGENGNSDTRKGGSSKVFKLLRERSRPGEIWLRAVRDKERLL